MQEQSEKQQVRGWRRHLVPVKILPLLMLLALVIRILAVLTRPLIQLDETAYVSMAENLAAGLGPLEITGESTTYFSPLLPLMIAGVAAIVNNYVTAAYIVVVTFGTLILLPAYLLGKEFINKRAGLMIAALVAVMPLMVDFSSRVYSESVYVFFLLLAVVFGRHMLMGCRIPCGTLAGASLGMAYLANPTAVYYVLALFVLGIIVGLVRGIPRQMARALAFFLIFFAIYAIPYVLFLHAELGEWTYTGKNVDVNAFTADLDLDYETVEFEQVATALTADKHELVVDNLEEQPGPIGLFIEHPKKQLEIFARQGYKLYNELLSTIIPIWLLPLLGLGLFSRGWSRRRLASVGYLALMLVPALLVLSIFAVPRFFMAYLVIVLVWVAEGWLRLEQWGAETLELVADAPHQRRWGRYVPWGVAAVVILPLLAYSWLTISGQDYQVENREAGEWIKANDGEDLRIMNRESTSAYYAGGTPVSIPYAEYDDTLEYARYQEVDYMVISRKVIEDWRPGLASLLDDDAAHPEWKLVQTFSPGGAGETFIFRFEG
jgi:4-amino-4-deoxy-L-arabinose transferase-like glycosyltransferase